MKTLAIRNGDLAIGPGGYEMIDGEEKVRQDLGVAAREPLGCDRFHPRWGTVLHSYVGSAFAPETEALVRAEIIRVVQNYVAVQGEQMQRDANYRNRPRYSTSEIIDRIENIDVRQEFDKLHVRVTLRTVAGRSVTVVRLVGV